MKLVKLILAGCTAVILAVLCGCSQIDPQPADQGDIDNIFTLPQTFTDAAVPAESIPQMTLTPQQIPAETVDMRQWFFHYRFVTELQQDALGKYLEYDGNEMHITYALGGMGGIVESGIGILLFVNGQPQPYRTGEDNTLRLIHNFFPPTDTLDHEVDLYFTPVDGKAGDTGSLYISLLYDTDYSLSEGMGLPKYTEDKLCGGKFRLIFRADPPQTQHADYEDRAISVSAGYTEVKHADIAGWSNEDLLERIEYRFSVNGSDGEADSKGTNLFNVPSSAPADIHLEIWGKAAVQYSVILFVDNKPVLLGDNGILTVETRTGEKVVVDAQLDISDSDGECVIYGMLIPLNGINTGTSGKWTNPLITYPFYVCTRSYEEMIG